VTLGGFEPLTVGELLDALRREPLAPGGGSVAAIVTAMAAALVEMVARSSHEVWDLAGGAVAQASELRRRAMELAAGDAEAYDAAVAALRGTGAEPLGEALSRAAEIPLQIAHTGVDIARLAALVAEHGAADLTADVVVAGLLATAATRGAAQLVATNLTTTAADPRVAQAQALEASAAAVDAGLRSLER
jgi:formiminotetrahydrofolate cyclodeaminase